MKEQAWGQNLKHLTEEESSFYIPASEERTGAPLLGYTRSPQKGGWDEIIYYTTRKRLGNFVGEGNYYVYVLSNENMPGLLKIGYTKKHPEERAKQVSRSTGVAGKYKVEFALRCHDGIGLEFEIHKELSYCRVDSQKEHFQVTLPEVKQKIEEIAIRYTRNNL